MKQEHVKHHLQDVRELLFDQSGQPPAKQRNQHTNNHADYPTAKVTVGYAKEEGSQNTEDHAKGADNDAEGLFYVVHPSAARYPFGFTARRVAW